MESGGSEESDEWQSILIIFFSIYLRKLPYLICESISPENTIQQMVTMGHRGKQSK